MHLWAMPRSSMTLPCCVSNIQGNSLFDWDLIEKKSKKLFSDAVSELHKNYIQSLDDQIIFIINYIINVLSKNTVLLKFISKNLSWGVYSKAVNKIYQKSETESKAKSILSSKVKDWKRIA